VAWLPGRQIVRREIWRGLPWIAVVAVVVADTDDLLASYIPSRSPFAFPPSADGRPHPWLGRTHWEGNGVLMLQRPGEAYAVWHFWQGAERAFNGWYLNLQEPFRRSAIGYDTQDLELDVWVPLEGDWQFKDEELLEVRVSDGRYTPEKAERIRALGGEIGAMLDRGERWWDDAWAAFTPDPTWDVPSFPEGWEAADVPSPPSLDALVALPSSGGG
jgi:hypothetical protein